MQAQFVCIAHNLMLILEGCVEKEGIENEIENNRRNNRLERVLASRKIVNKKLPDFLVKPKRTTQRSVKFIRWLRNHLYSNTSWREALGPLQRIYATFWDKILDTVVLSIICLAPFPLPGTLSLYWSLTVFVRIPWTIGKITPSVTFSQNFYTLELLNIILASMFFWNPLIPIKTWTLAAHIYIRIPVWLHCAVV